MLVVSRYTGLQGRFQEAGALFIKDPFDRESSALAGSDPGAGCEAGARLGSGLSLCFLQNLTQSTTIKQANQPPPT